MWASSKLPPPPDIKDEAENTAEEKRSHETLGVLAERLRWQQSLALKNGDLTLTYARSARDGLRVAGELQGPPMSLSRSSSLSRNLSPRNGLLFGRELLAQSPSLSRSSSYNRHPSPSQERDLLRKAYDKGFAMGRRVAPQFPRVLPGTAGPSRTNSSACSRAHSTGSLSARSVCLTRPSTGSPLFYGVTASPNPNQIAFEGSAITPRQYGMYPTLHAKGPLPSPPFPRLGTTYGSNPSLLQNCSLPSRPTTRVQAAEVIARVFHKAQLRTMRCAFKHLWHHIITNVIQNISAVDFRNLKSPTFVDSRTAAADNYWLRILLGLRTLTCWMDTHKHSLLRAGMSQLFLHDRHDTSDIRQQLDFSGGVRMPPPPQSIDSIVSEPPVLLVDPGKTHDNGAPSFNSCHEVVLRVVPKVRGDSFNGPSANGCAVEVTLSSGPQTPGPDEFSFAKLQPRTLETAPLNSGSFERHLCAKLEEIQQAPGDEVATHQANAVFLPRVPKSVLRVEGAPVLERAYQDVLGTSSMPDPQSLPVSFRPSVSGRVSEPVSRTTSESTHGRKSDHFRSHLESPIGTISGQVHSERNSIGAMKSSKDDVDSIRAKYSAAGESEWWTDSKRATSVSSFHPDERTTLPRTYSTSESTASRKSVHFRPHLESHGTLPGLGLGRNSVEATRSSVVGGEVRYSAARMSEWWTDSSASSFNLDERKILPPDDSENSSALSQTPQHLHDLYTPEQVSRRSSLAAEALGVARHASRHTVAKAFRECALTYHPDKGGDKDDFQVVNEAYKRLMEQSS